MSSFNAPYERSPIEEVVPESMKLRGLSKASILTGRRRIRIIPQTGTFYSPAAGQTLANILVQDSAGLLDLQSCVLSFQLKVTDGTSSTSPGTVCVPDDFAWSVLRRLQVSLNSVLCDDVDYVAKRATAEVYASASKSWYSSVGTLMGAWKFLGDSAGTGAAPSYPQSGPGAPTTTVPKNDIDDKLVAATARFKNVVWSAAASAWVNASSDGAGQYFAFPMSMLSHFFRQESLFSLRNAGQLYIQLLFANANETLYCPAGGGSYTVTNLVLEVDVVTAHPEYTAMVDEICSRSENEGMAYAFDAHLVSAQNIGQASAVAIASQTQQTFTVIASKATQNCRALHWIMQPQSGLQSQSWLEQSTFNCNDTNQWQIRIGSVYYPAFPSQGLAKNFMELMSSYNSPTESVGQACVIDQQSWKATTASGGAVYGVTASGSVPDNQLFHFSDQYIGGYCFDNLKHAEVLSHDGISTLAMSGSQIQLEIRATPLELGTVVTYFIRFTRTVLLSENGVQIIG